MSSAPDSAPAEGAATQQGDAAAGPAGLSAEEAMLLGKYRQERARRIRADDTAQFRKTEGDLARFFLTDPAAAPQADRQPVDEEIDVVVVGGGWSGILTAVRLVQAGVTSHSSRWDYAYTGGDEKGNLISLADKRIALIGTGCSGVQCAPPLARSAKQLYVVQRTPTAIAPRDNQATSPEWAAKLGPGWQKARMANFEQVLMGLAAENHVGDEWARFWEAPSMPTPGADAAMAATAAQKMDIAKMEEMRARIDLIVDDPETAESLKPYYNRFCKRPTFSDEYLQAFNRPNVKLIDTRGRD
jgi:cation diffusion facilitator CzcD-associated flavoprotein CzcO